MAVGTMIDWLYAEGEAVAAAPSAPVATGPVPMYGPKPVEVILPKGDIDMSHGTLAVWHVAEGETVKQGAPLFDIETDKAAMEVEAPATGRLHHIRAIPGDKVPVGAVVVWICPEGMAVGPPPQPV